MKHHHAAGFTLMELLIALALTSVVAVGALAALNTFTDADRLASQRMEENVGIGRALQTVRRDVAEATSLDVTATEWVITRRDGTGVAYALAVGGTELHRFQAATPAAAASDARAAALAGTTAPTYSARGHLKDSDYRAAAILQGVSTITGTAVTRGGSTLGIEIVVGSVKGETTKCLAMSMPLLETYSKSTAVSGGSGGGGGGGLLDGLGGLLNGSK